MKYWKFTFAALVLIALPSVAQANAGTPLMWAGMLHLFIGNAFIGLLEGILLIKLFKAPKMKAVGLMILANYFSAWIGGLFLHGPFRMQRTFQLTRCCFNWERIISVFMIRRKNRLPLSQKVEDPSQ